MSLDQVIIYVLTAILLIASLIADRQKTLRGLKKGGKAFMKLMPVLLPLFLFIGILLAIVTPDFISKMLGEESGFMGMIFALVVGSITFMPAFLSYPLGAELIASGAGVAQVAAFLATLMSVGVVYYAAESKLFSKKAAIYRNVVSFIGALLIILIVLVVY
ncbi:hypothetical protein KQ51_00930 [Candidatus Izimaplasma bacterium HR1]|uniref:hypothetical protein n=1 Tax=Candidatus Izimoplasma sp. HR1 TaxID=1541959 RepID=UPI0004F69138|nr:hypothetical protein KQ51_00930 [Candidatus Izimaplasma bacterium HR1]